jgi:hypothetical protein
VAAFANALACDSIVSLGRFTWALRLAGDALAVSVKRGCCGDCSARAGDLAMATVGEWLGVGRAGSVALFVEAAVWEVRFTVDSLGVKRLDLGSDTLATRGASAGVSVTSVRGSSAGRAMARVGVGVEGVSGCGFELVSRRLRAILSSSRCDCGSR